MNVNLKKISLILVLRALTFRTEHISYVFLCLYGPFKWGIYDVAQHLANNIPLVKTQVIPLKKTCTRQFITKHSLISLRNVILLLPICNFGFLWNSYLFIYFRSYFLDLVLILCSCLYQRFQLIFAWTYVCKDVHELVPILLFFYYFYLSQ